MAVKELEGRDPKALLGAEDELEQVAAAAATMVAVAAAGGDVVGAGGRTPLTAGDAGMQVECVRAISLWPSQLDHCKNM